MKKFSSRARIISYNKTIQLTDRIITQVCDVEGMEKCLTQRGENCVKAFDILLI